MQFLFFNIFYSKEELMSCRMQCDQLLKETKNSADYGQKQKSLK